VDERAVLLGFLARQRTRRPDWLDAPRVSEVSNASIDSCGAIGLPGENPFALRDCIEDALDTFDCNSVAEEVPTNERCLLDDVNDAYRMSSCPGSKPKQTIPAP